MEAVIGFFTLILLLSAPQDALKEKDASSGEAVGRIERRIDRKETHTMDDGAPTIGEAEHWSENINKHMAAINAALQADRSAVGICDIRLLENGYIGVITITDYGFTIAHVFDPAERKIVYSEAVLFNKADRERFTIFFIRGRPPRNRYLAVPVVRERDRAVLGWIGIPLNRTVRDKKGGLTPKIQIIE
jgi:hypothetical protein